MTFFSFIIIFWLPRVFASTDSSIFICPYLPTRLYLNYSTTLDSRQLVPFFLLLYEYLINFRAQHFSLLFRFCLKTFSSVFQTSKSIESALLDTRHDWGICYNFKLQGRIIQQEYIDVTLCYRENCKDQMDRFGGLFKMPRKHQQITN